MKQNTESKFTHLWSVNLGQRRQEDTMKTVSSISNAGETGQLHVKEIKTIYNIIYKNKLKMD